MSAFDIEEIKRTGVVKGLKSAIEYRIRSVINEFEDYKRDTVLYGVTQKVNRASAALDEIRVLMAELKELEPKNS